MRIRPSVSGTWVSHGHSSRRIEASTGFVLDDQTQGRTERRRRDHLESKSRIEWHVPRDVSERCERDCVVALSDRPGADGSDEFRPETAAPVLGMNIDLLEMSDGWLDDLDVRKPDGNIIREGDPEIAVTLGGFQDFVAGRLVENRLRCVANKGSGSRELYRWQHRQILGPGRCDRVHVF